METLADLIFLGVILAVIGVFALALYITNREDEKEELENFLAKNLPVAYPYTLRTGVSGESKVINVSFGIPYDTPDKNGNVVTKEALEGALRGGNIAPFSMGYVDPLFEAARVLKLKTGKKLMWGCSLCPDKVYKHAPSVYNHIKAAHK